MKSATTKRKEALLRRLKIKSDEDRELSETLERLKVWRTENLMAPHGMDKFAEDIRKARDKRNKYKSVGHNSK
jgi:hypothetical protein